MGGRPRGQPHAGEQLRLQAYLARAGVASRRASEELIREGRVRVNGKAAELGSKVVVGRDRVAVDGREVQPLQPVWIALHKPRGYVTTRSDPRGRRTIYDLLPQELHHLFHVGRLDRDSSGLLLLTNEGDAANRLLHPRYGISKEYVVDVDGRPTESELRQLVEGIRLDDGWAHAEAVEVVGELPSGQYRLRLELREGKNREVRRMLDALGHPVHRLFRRSFGPIGVGKLRRGEWRYLTAEEAQRLSGARTRPGTREA